MRRFWGESGKAKNQGGRNKLFKPEAFDALPCFLIRHCASEGENKTEMKMKVKRTP